MASIIIRSLMTRCLCIVMHNTFQQTTVIKPRVETTLMMATPHFIRKDVTLVMPVVTNNITIYSRQWAFITGAELVSPAPIVNCGTRRNICNRYWI